MIAVMMDGTRYQGRDRVGIVAAMAKSDYSGTPTDTVRDYAIRVARRMSLEVDSVPYDETNAADFVLRALDKRSMLDGIYPDSDFAVYTSPPKP
jgi:hypothetical protein